MCAHVYFVLWIFLYLPSHPNFEFFAKKVFYLIKIFLNIMNVSICFWLCQVFVPVCRLSLVAASQDYSLASVHELLIAVATL